MEIFFSRIPRVILKLLSYWDQGAGSSGIGLAWILSGSCQVVREVQEFPIFTLDLLRPVPGTA